MLLRVVVFVHFVCPGRLWRRLRRVNFVVKRMSPAELDAFHVAPHASEAIFGVDAVSIMGHLVWRSGGIAHINPPEANKWKLTHIKFRSGR